MQAIRKDGSEVRQGDQLTSDKDTYTYISATQPNGPGHDGKVYVSDRTGFKRTFYARIFDLTVRE